MRFRLEARQTLAASLESSRLGGAFTRSIKVLSAVGTAVVIWFGASRVLAGALTPGDLVVFVTYVTELYVPIQSLSELSVQFLESLVSGERVMELLKTAPRIKDEAHATKAPRFHGEIVFENVSASYDPGSRVLRGVSFRARAGQKVALVGGSGAGKSTIINLLLRFLDPSEGRILIDGVDIRRYTLHSLRAQAAVVLQEAILFRRSVRENIAYGKPGATTAEVLAAAKAARAHEFIERLPQGYDTMLDESGANLSGGQRQRIALARAFLRDAPILILDEPSTGLDPVTEAELSETLAELARGRTTIVVAHKLASIEDADLIVVLERGVVVEQGAHAELLGRNGLYRRMRDVPVAS
jgi:ABC-type multidrug transport system fused ATPase/permease subunit